MDQRLWREVNIFIIPSPKGVSCRSVGRIAENELPLPNGEVVGPRAKIACPKSPKKSGLKQEAEFPPRDIQVA